MTEQMNVPFQATFQLRPAMTESLPSCVITTLWSAIDTHVMLEMPADINYAIVFSLFAPLSKIIELGFLL